jgi:protoheme IX farnesyltransferase
MKHSAEQTTSTHSIREILLAYYELTKPGITLMVLSSMAIGFLLGSAGSISFLTLLNAALGTYMIAAGTAAHNQYLERSLDKLMIRTNRRPLPMDRIEDNHAKIFSLSLIFTGLLYLILTVNVVAGLVSLATSFIYLVLYTPLKQISFWNVPIGSIAGALPPVGGWAAATGSVNDPGMWLLFAIVFFWQMPHVLAIAWLCNDDYTNAGFKMLPKNDSAGKKTGLISLLCLILLIPTIYALYSLGYNSLIYLIPSLIITGWFMVKGLQFYHEPEKTTAKSLMFASFFYLPIVWIFILIDNIILRLW